ncbi:acyltransferase [bacterium]|nr:acyltransferase [bacterium]
MRIGDDTGLSGAAVCAARSVSIGAGCLIGANAAITDCDFHAVAPENRRYNTSPDAVGCAPVIIGDNVWIGMNVIILKGVTIGRNSIIGAGSVVTKSIPPDCFAAGQPAVVRRQLSSAEDAAALRTRADGSAG